MHNNIFRKYLLNLYGIIVCGIMFSGFFVNYPAANLAAG